MLSTWCREVMRRGQKSSLGWQNSEYVCQRIIRIILSVPTYAFVSPHGIRMYIIDMQFDYIFQFFRDDL